MPNIKVFPNQSDEYLSVNEFFKIRILSGFLLVIISFSFTVSAASWDLDPTFGSGGKVIWSPNGNTQSLRGSGMAVQADGKIVMVGGSIGSGVTGFTIVRFKSNGSLDTTFGNNGVSTITFGGTNEIVSSVAIQPDGKIVVGGRATLASNTDIAIARLNSDGSLDPTFDGDGKVTIDFNQPDYLNVLKVADGGKIVFAGESIGMGTASFHRTIGRLNTNGSLDTTFAGTGKFIDGNGTGDWEDLVIHPNGAITLTGTASAQFSSSVSVRRYNSDGSFAWSWHRSIQPGCYMSLRGIAGQSDGKLIVVGSNLCKPVAIRINSDGTDDTTFNNTPLNFNGQAFAVAVQPDGKILATVGNGAHNEDGFSLVRYNTDGSLDSGFGNAGIARIRILNGYEVGSKIIIQPDGKILVGGAASIEITSNYRFAMVRYQGASAVPVKSTFDYDGDGKSDISVFRPSENKWFILKSSDSSVAQPIFGASGDIPTPADFDGDGKTDPAVFRPSTGVWWYLSSINNSQIAAQWGQSGDVPRPSDFDGDGKADFIVYRPGDNKWYRLSSSGSGSSVVQFGAAGDTPLIGDFDGDGKADPAIYRPSTGAWWYAASSLSGAHRAVQFGLSNDTPVPADFDGDGKTDFAVYRASNGVWHILQSSNNNYIAYQFGIAEDKAVAADYDGDGKADKAVFRPSNGSWYQMRSTSGFVGAQWGAANDIPTQNAFVP